VHPIYFDSFWLRPGPCHCGHGFHGLDGLGTELRFSLRKPQTTGFPFLIRQIREIRVQSVIDSAEAGQEPNHPGPPMELQSEAAEAIVRAEAALTGSRAFSGSDQDVPIREAPSEVLDNSVALARIQFLLRALVESGQERKRERNV
jgi:hypothetical protein